MTTDLTKASDVKHKVVNDYDSLLRLVDGLRVVNNKIVVTIGSWDLLHIGHVRYLRKAKEQGDILIVGVDSDRTVKKYKGELRPIVPYSERCEMLTYQSCVDFVANVDDVDKKGNWLYGLIKKIKPDVFVAVEDSYPQKQLREIKKYCGKLIVLSRQAERTSTTRMIQYAVKKHLDKMYELLDKRAHD
jgi:D-beta-D-heptose 7-phosphate kinase/D-beta-D-heptose 1-phosphate adenosyltransferase